ncbi:C39 family peptidase [Pseudoflavonifractor phocaeensis]|uniref:C39 family peptidase n=1 Tax=Pseudoflavonifractor phocaeensis TaxID=1870988 RepID=UPI0030B893EE
MAEERKDSFAETVDTAASAAHTIKGAIKAGKAISGAAKGAAAGGPYGAVAGAVWAGRKHIGKIIAVIIILLLLPVLFILMLPGLIFGGLINAFSPADTEQPVLNSETAIVENANDITFTINSILGEALDDVMARIEADFAASGADQMEVKNLYSSGPVYNANLIISQYCAARDEDFESISLDDLAAVLRENKEHLYSYTSVRESREVTSEDPETGEETTTTEIWMVYTIRYNGESYLADHIFALTDEQKELASDYASNLSMFLGDGLLQNLTEWTGNSIPSLGDVTFTDGVTPVVYFNQLDERYASQPYGTDNIGGYGCGPTAMSIVVSSLTDETVDPVAMAQWSYENGYWCKSSGSYHALIPAAAEAWGLPVSGCTTSEPQRILDALAEGKLVVAIMAEGHFTSSGHFIVLRGVKDGQIMVADPASYKRSEQLWDLSIILSNVLSGSTGRCCSTVSEAVLSSDGAVVTVAVFSPSNALCGVLTGLARDFTSAGVSPFCGALWGSCGGAVHAAGPAGGSAAFLTGVSMLFSTRSAWAPALIIWMPKPASVRAWLSASFWAAFTKSRLSWVVCWAVLILNGSASLRSRNTLASKIAICSVIRSAVRRIRPLGWAMRNQSFW